LLDLPAGVGAPGTFFLQGLVRDDRAPNKRVAVMNGIIVEVF
jgi:hypothetical protein